MARSSRVIAWLLLGTAGLSVAIAVRVLIVGGGTAVDRTLAPSSGPVRLEVPRVYAREGQYVHVTVVNGLPRIIFWGDCFVLQRLVDLTWQPMNYGICLGLQGFSPHSRTEEGTCLSGDAPGLYRVALPYDVNSETRFPLRADTYVDVKPALRSAKSC